MAKKFAMVVGVVFVLVGLLGFVGNPIVGRSGMFLTNAVHDVAHILIGVIILVMAGSKPNTALTVFGVVYLLLAVLGFVMQSPLLGLVEVNAADNWLHVVLGVVLLAAGLGMKPSAPAGNMGMPSSTMPS
jgi:hypothetical protein